MVFIQHWDIIIKPKMYTFTTNMNNEIDFYTSLSTVLVVTTQM